MSGMGTRTTWTTDPDLSGNGIEFAEYDEVGVLEPIDDRRTLLEGTMLTLLGNRAESQGRLYFPGSVAERLRLRAQKGRRSSYVKPDLMVFPPACELPTGAHRDRSDCALRVHEGAPPPELAVEILSVSSVARDYGVKRQLYAALGVREYWICDVDGIRQPSSPVELQAYRPAADRTYAEVPPAWTDAAPDEAPAFWSEVCSRHIHLVPGDYAPRFQWYDEYPGRWRDSETDAQDEKDRIQQESRAEGRAKGRAEGRTEEAVERCANSCRWIGSRRTWIASRPSGVGMVRRPTPPDASGPFCTPPTSGGPCCRFRTRTTTMVPTALLRSATPIDSRKCRGSCRSVGIAPRAREITARP